MPLADELELETPAGLPNVKASFFTPMGSPVSLLTDSLKQKLLMDVADIPAGRTAKLDFHFTTEGWRASLAARKTANSYEWMIHVWAADPPGPGGLSAGTGGSVTF